MFYVALCNAWSVVKYLNVSLSRLITSVGFVRYRFTVIVWFLFHLPGAWDRLPYLIMAHPGPSI